MSQKRIEKPWGYEVIWASTDNYVGKLIHINAGHRLSKQYHTQKEETIYVMEGLLYDVDEFDNVQRFEPGESFHIEPGQIHRFQAWGMAVDLIEVSTNHLDDVIRLEDDYRR
jgi:quercetin dioxygenase-like cupin family protein